MTLRGMRRSCTGLLLGCLALGVTHPPGASAQVLMTQEEALRLAFPDARVERETAFLDQAQLDSARALAGGDVEIEGTVVTYYTARSDDGPVGVAYFDAHRVRTLDEVVMVVVSPDETIERVEVLKFAEPPEYLAPDGWIAQVEGRELGPGLSLKGDVVNMTGATLTANALVAAARRVLALHRVISPLKTGSR